MTTPCGDNPAAPARDSAADEHRPAETIAPIAISERGRQNASCERVRCPLAGLPDAMAAHMSVEKRMPGCCGAVRTSQWCGTTSKGAPQTGPADSPQGTAIPAKPLSGGLVPGAHLGAGGRTQRTSEKPKLVVQHPQAPFGPPGAYAPGGSSSSCCMTTHSHCAWTNEGGHVSPSLFAHNRQKRKLVLIRAPNWLKLLPPGVSAPRGRLR